MEISDKKAHKGEQIMEIEFKPQLNHFDYIKIRVWNKTKIELVSSLQGPEEDRFWMLPVLRKYK